MIINSLAGLEMYNNQLQQLQLQQQKDQAQQEIVVYQNCWEGGEG